MTQDTDPAGTGVQTPPGVDAGETASQPPSDAGSGSTVTVDSPPTPDRAAVEADAAGAPSPKPGTARRSAWSCGPASRCGRRPPSRGSGICARSAASGARGG